MDILIILAVWDIVYFIRHKDSLVIGSLVLAWNDKDDDTVH